MKHICCRALCLGLILAWVAGPAFVHETSAAPARPPLVSRPAVTVSLSLSGYSFPMAPPVAEPAGTTAPAAQHPIPVQPVFFQAMLQLANRTSESIPFEFTMQPVVSTNYAEFIVRNEAGDEVWRAFKPREDVVFPMVVYLRTMVLRPDTIWQVPVAVPLAPGGQPLLPGTYTLEACVKGTPRYTATAPFEVVEPLVFSALKP